MTVVLVLIGLAALGAAGWYAWQIVNPVDWLRDE